MAAMLLFVLLACTNRPDAEGEEDPEYGSAPILRINGEHHFGTISRMGITADGSIVATASRDNTIKIWTVSDMTPIATLRVPISNDYAQAPGAADLRALDISPDGRLVAAAGLVRIDGTSRVFVFNVASGEMIATPLTVRGYVADLAFSRDGALLAAGVASMDDANNGLWVWDTQNWGVIFRDAAYAGETERGRRINGIRFASSGVLITTSYDRRIRRYANIRAEDPGLTSIPAPEGFEPYDVDISPDGASLLVGYLKRNTATRVVLYQNNDAISHVRDFDVSNIAPGANTAATVAYGVGFSRSGNFVYASLAIPERDLATVRRWSVNDEAPARDIPVCTDYNIIQISPYGNDGAILANTDPCLTVVGDDGEIVPSLRRRGGRYPITLSPPPATDDGLFLVSRRGDRLYLRGSEPGSGFAFDLTRRELRRDPVLTAEERGALDGYTASIPNGLTVSNWADSDAPRIAPTPGAAPVDLPLADQAPGVYSRSFSVDVAASGRFAVLGTIFFTQRFNAQGQAEWQPAVRMPGLGMRTNITPDENVVVIFYDDGAIRWHDARDGSVMLSLLVSADARHWVLWTPSGYYDASPGSDDLIGWHLNHGRDRAASFEPASRYQDVFYRPDIVNAVVETIVHGQSRSGGEEAVRIARSDSAAQARVRASAPPITRLIAMRTVDDREGSGVVVSFSAQSPSGKTIDAIRVRVDGRTYVERQIRVTPGRRLEERVPVRAGDRYVTVSAHTEDGWGSPAVRRLPVVRATQAPEQQTAARRPTLHALVVGVNDYQGTRFDPLNFAVADAEAFASFLRSQENSQFFGRVNVRPMVNQEATAEAVREQLFHLANEEVVRPDDIVVIFLAGHGFTDPRGRYFYVPYGARAGTGGLRMETMIQDTTLSDVIDMTPARVLVFIDTCQAHAAVHRGFVNRMLSLQKDVYIFTSATESQRSYEDERWGHGAFTRALLDGVQGRADNQPRDRRISSEELEAFLIREVGSLTGNQQRPQLFDQGPDRRSAQSIQMFEVRR